MNESSKIALLFIGLAFCSSCNSFRSNERNVGDSISILQDIDRTTSPLPTKSEEKFLSKYSESEVLNLIDHNHDSVAAWGNTDIQELKHIDSCIIVLNRLKLATGERRQAFELCVIKEVKGRLQLTVKGIIKDTRYAEENYYVINPEIDTNAYNINQNEFAIGVIGTPTWIHNSLNYYNLGTNLILFRIIQDRLCPIVQLPLAYTHGDRHIENDSIISVGGEVSDSSSVQILGSKTNGYFDLLLKTKSTRSSVESQKPVVTLRYSTYKWDNERYIKSDEK